MMKEEYKIKLINKDDVSRFVQIFRDSFNPEYLIPSIYRGLGIEKFIQNELDNTLSPYRYFGLYHNNEIVGCAEYKIINRDTFFLNLIASDNNYKGKGIGSILFKYAEEYFCKRGYNRIQLDVFQNNGIALKWYKSLGFKELNKKSIYKSDIINYDETKYLVYILNYPQFLKIVDSYGFNYLDVMIDSAFVRLGFIENDLIIRGDYNEYSSIAAAYILNKLDFKSIYFIGEDVKDSPELTFMDNILRMELNLSR